VKLLKGIAMALVVCAAAGANTIYYQEQGIASGTLDGTMFANVLVTVQVAGDTAALSNLGFGIFLNAGTSEIFVPGVGMEVFTDLLEAEVDQGLNAGGIFDASQAADIMFTTADPAFHAYSLANGFGPTSSSGSINPSGDVFPTSGGFVYFSGFGNTTFTASLTPFTPTPEPGSLAGLLAVGLAGLIAARRARHD